MSYDPLFSVVYRPRPEALDIYDYLERIADKDKIARPTMLDLGLARFSTREVTRGIVDLCKGGIIRPNYRNQDGYKIKGGSLGR